MLLWILAVCYIVIFLVDKYIKRNYSTIEKCFPGPPTIPIIGNVIMLWRGRKDVRSLGELITWKYRRSFRLWLGPIPVVGIMTPKDVETVFNNTEHIQKSLLYNTLLPWIGRGLLTSFGSKWKTRRRLLTPAFHFQILETFMDIFERNGDILCNKLTEKVNLSGFNVYKLVKLYALDNICETSMGTTINAQTNSDSDYVRAINKMCDITFTKIISPWLQIDPIFKLLPMAKEQQKALSVIHSLSRNVIEKRRQNFKNKQNEDFNVDDDLNIKRKQVFLDILLKASEEHGLSLADIQEEVDTFMFEGHDTITSAISFAMYNLALHPQYQKKAFEEQYEIFELSDRQATYQDLQSMKYLEMVIKETLRIYPSVPLMGRYATQDIVLDEKATIPKNVDILVMVGPLHESDEVWERPNEFYPDHFLPEVAAKRHPYQYIPFSAGPRNCIGMKFAMMELKSALSKVLRRFELLPSEPEVPIHLVYDLILTARDGIHIAIKERNVENSVIVQTNK